MLELERFSFGVGDRFAHQAKAQLSALKQASELPGGPVVVPVWNKSNREHLIVGSEPPSVLAAAQSAVAALGWQHPFHVDADHIRLETVDRFLPVSDFFTIDVADSIGAAPPAGSVEAFLDRHPELSGRYPLTIAGIEAPLNLTPESSAAIAAKYLAAVQEAGRIYRYIANNRGADNFITEVSMDETDAPQTPPELLIILAALADEQIPLQTIAPKFTGRFNKGVDYVGDTEQFEREFRDDLAVIADAISRYGLPANLKLSVHSGSDKFSIYRPIAEAVLATGAGLHLKTAGTTWLEEVIGLAESGGEGLALAKEIYAGAIYKCDDLCAPYASVIDIDKSKLPSTETVNGWSSEQYVNALRHQPGCQEYNSSLRQLIHVGYKVAAQMGDRYLDMLVACEPAISRCVRENLFERHLVPLFIHSAEVD